ncbi:MAG: ABC transporter permease [Dehalococcoidales bacterium]|nr:MAG: ABC transporter permease [Dehalococcoidales bacterium]
MIEFEKLRIIAAYEFLKHVRRKRLYVILGLTLISELAVIILLPLLMDGKYPDNVITMAATLTVGPSLATIGAVFFAGDAIAGEFEGRTGFILFTNPVKRTTLILGKYLASCAAVTLLVIFGYIITVITLFAIYGEVPGKTLNSFGLCLLFGGAVLSITFFFSSISKGSMGATVITLVVIMVISGIVESVLIMAGKPYFYLPSVGGDAIALVYGGMDLYENIIPAGGAGMGGMEMLLNMKVPDIGHIAYSMTGYLVICLGLSLWISRRRQLA